MLFECKLFINLATFVPLDIFAFSAFQILGLKLKVTQRYWCDAVCRDLFFITGKM
ncbi:MAG: hypothetical protein RMK94_11670 [Armatimonadota bacterium]|nr:hypothetical protein [Armatimonadota bacterium]